MWGLWRREGTPEGFSLVLKKKSSASRCKITWIIPTTLFPLMLGMVSTSTETVTSIGMGQFDELVGWTPQALGSLRERSSLGEEGGWRGTWAVSHPGKRRWRGDKEQLTGVWGLFSGEGKECGDLKNEGDPGTRSESGMCLGENWPYQVVGKILPSLKKCK